MTSKSVSVVVRAKTRKTNKPVSKKKTGLQQAHYDRFQRKINGVIRGVGRIGTATRASIADYWKLWDWIITLPGYEEAAAKGEASLNAFKRKLNGGTELSNQQMVILNRSKRIRDNWDSVAAAQGAGTIIAACNYKPRDPESKTAEPDWRQEVIDALAIQDEYAKLHATDKEAAKKRKEEKEAAEYAAKKAAEQNLKEAEAKVFALEQADRVRTAEDHFDALMLKLATETARKEIWERYERELTGGELNAAIKTVKKVADSGDALNHLRASVFAILIPAMKEPMVKKAIAKLTIEVKDAA
jgi:hypothetical protein